MSTENHPLLTTTEAAAALRHSPAALKDWALYGRGPNRPIKIGVRVFWKRSEVERLFAGGAQ